VGAFVRGTGGGSRRLGRAWRLWPLVAAALLACGCGGNKSQPAAAGPTPIDREAAGEAIDECATRLQDISGQILLYYLKNRRMPASLEELHTMPGGDPKLPLSCPVSNQPYAYDPVGYPVADKPHRLVAFDTVPVHRGGRWGLLMAEPEEGKALSMWVARLNEDVFKALVPPGGARPQKKPAAPAGARP